MHPTVYQSFQESIKVKEKILADEKLTKDIELSAQKMIAAFQQNKKVLLCGNGGSASDAQHIAAELTGRFYIDRPALDAEALHVNGSYLTAVANDYSFDVVYQRMLEAKGQEGDVLIAISTSGNSANIVNAVKKAKEMSITTIGFTGSKTGAMDEFCDILLKVPSEITPRIQECHILIGHILCEIVEDRLFGNN